MSVRLGLVLALIVALVILLSSVTGAYAKVLVDEDFDGDPAGWNAASSSGAVWMIGDGDMESLFDWSHFDDPFASAAPFLEGAGATSTTLTTNNLYFEFTADVTASFAGSFDAGDGNAMTGYFEISTGIGWQTVATFTSDDIDAVKSYDLSALVDGEDSVRLRWRAESGGNTGYWAIDAVTLEGECVYDGNETLAADDGSYEKSIGATSGDVEIVNCLEPEYYPARLTQLQGHMRVGSSGRPIHWLVYRGTVADGPEGNNEATIFESDDFIPLVNNWNYLDVSEEPAFAKPIIDGGWCIGWYFDATDKETLGLNNVSCDANDYQEQTWAYIGNWNKIDDLSGTLVYNAAFRGLTDYCSDVPPTTTTTIPGTTTTTTTSPSTTTTTSPGTTTTTSPGTTTTTPSTTTTTSPGSTTSTSPPTSTTTTTVPGDDDDDDDTGDDDTGDDDTGDDDVIDDDVIDDDTSDDDTSDDDSDDDDTGDDDTGDDDDTSDDDSVDDDDTADDDDDEIGEGDDDDDHASDDELGIRGDDGQLSVSSDDDDGSSGSCGC
ncbi:MAG: hypothetical protein H6684_13780 [Deltaproteobacteria bacterium]|nr:hypothetical protein [Deltaproteobacteria bacterium]MCB9478672.1 hypothetical protein [Deltaproteobacteria bacterium]MCB9489798.1 hypothetical protein [Deltaproteobacteria bacterium]